MSQNYYLLNHLDDPMRFLFFTVDEFASLAVPLFIGMFFNQMLYGALVALILYQGLKWVKKVFKGAGLRQLAYWFLPTKKSVFKIYVPSCLKEFQG